ncbi:hypothetical protein LSH36_353g10058, partial [Paralvinella palmiformis]
PQSPPCLLQEPVDGNSCFPRFRPGVFQFTRTVRTNNDVEGWHNRLNNMATSQSSINIYKLIHLLHKEDKHLNLQLLLLCNGAVLRYQHNKYRRVCVTIDNSLKQLNINKRSS